MSAEYSCGGGYRINMVLVMSASFLVEDVKPQEVIPNYCFFN